jgi:hypothetical protein
VDDGSGSWVQVVVGIVTPPLIANTKMCGEWMGWHWLLVLGTDVSDRYSSSSTSSAG